MNYLNKYSFYVALSLCLSSAPLLLAIDGTWIPNAASIWNDNAHWTSTTWPGQITTGGDIARFNGDAFLIIPRVINTVPSANVTLGQLLMTNPSPLTTGQIQPTSFRFNSGQPNISALIELLNSGNTMHLGPFNTSNTLSLASPLEINFLDNSLLGIQYQIQGNNWFIR